MRKISILPIIVFIALYTASIVIGIYTAMNVCDLFHLAGYREIAIIISSITFFFACLILFYRIFMRTFPLTKGLVKTNSREEFIYNVYVLFYIMGFNSLIRSHILPLPALRMLYLALGAKIGNNSYTSGIIYDPMFVKIGENTLLGQNSLLTPHAIESKHISYDFITIGDNVTVGANAILMQGVSIGNNAIIGASSLVSKGTVIGDNEIWGGVPAKFIKMRED
ncbi:MAG: acyltransferase [Alphaproteobacteria bacterium]|nr:acyltransferase [Alphaproteobacteria bacterium]